jgi:hypothetical protein
MTSIVCDGCRKEVQEARKDVNYVTMLDKDLCLNCEEKLRVNMRQQTFARRPILFKDYQENLSKTLGKITGGRSK